MSRFTRRSSPSGFDDETYTTAASGTSFQDMANMIHSTPQREHDPLPLHYDQHPDVYDHTQGSADMSIEIGRGVKRGADQQVNDDSSNAIFSFGDDHSQYEITGTPPIRPRTNHRKSDGTLRKEASVRRATESARANDALKKTVSGAKPRSVSENMVKSAGNVDEVQAPATATFTVRGSRFAGARHVSSSYNLPTRFAANGGLQSGPRTANRPAVANPTVQSATYTANQSFLLPDVPDLTELVSGVRADGTPFIKRSTATRSRFVSASYRPETQLHLPVEGLSVPEDEQAIFASLRLLSDKVNQLEHEKTQAQNHLQAYEREVIELRTQLHEAAGGPDSGIGSEDGNAEPQLSRTEKARLQAKVKATEECLERTERKASVSDITITRVSKERDHLIKQLATAYYNNEELEKENEAFRERIYDLQAENEEFKDLVHTLQNENARMQKQLARYTKPQGEEIQVRQKASSSRIDLKGAEQEDDIACGLTLDGVTLRNKKESAIRRERSMSRKRSDQIDAASQRDLSSRLEQEIQRQRDAALAKTGESRHADRSTARCRSKSQRRQSFSQDDAYSTSRQKRHVSAQADLDLSELNTSAENATTRRSKAQQFEDDLTQLTDLDPLDVARLRMKLEEELRTKHAGRGAPSRAHSEGDFTAHSTTRQPLSRRSSLKTTGAGDEGTGRFNLRGDPLDDILKDARKVRVQSPHTADEISHSEHQATDEAGDASLLSNISRRRRRTASADGMTSAFIIPDITVQSNMSLPANLGKACIQHNAMSCTACANDGTQVDIPMPIPVTDREDMADMTNATIRPSQPPSIALATVIKHLEDEITHLKLKLNAETRKYNLHDPALSKRKRLAVKAKMDSLMTEIEKRSNQVYALYDVLEGQKDQAGRKQAEEMNMEELNDTLRSSGFDPIELSGRVGRKAPAGLADDVSDDSDLPFEGFSELDSEEEQEIRV